MTKTEKTYKIIARAGRVKKDLYFGLDYALAEDICDDYGWEIELNGEGSFVWDLEIEEE